MTPTYCDGPEKWRPGCGTCGTCGRPLTGKAKWFCRATAKDPDSCRLVWLRNHDWSEARKAAIKRDKACVYCGCSAGLEVNHKSPRKGKGYNTDCAHHQAELETTCHDCHLLVTKAQRIFSGGLPLQERRRTALYGTKKRRQRGVAVAHMAQTVFAFKEPQ